MTDQQRQSIGIGLLSFTAGSMDAIAFLALGDVFTSAMTGNTVLLGLAIGQGQVSAAMHSLTAFLGYAFGVALAVLPLRRPACGIEQTVVLEALVLAGFGRSGAGQRGHLRSICLSSFQPSAWVCRAPSGGRSRYPEYRPS
jgi:uncharacterized membrane protein YoaK (UPF0700 family)